MTDQFQFTERAQWLLRSLIAHQKRVITGLYGSDVAESTEYDQLTQFHEDHGWETQATLSNNVVLTSRHDENGDLIDYWSGEPHLIDIEG